MKHKEGIHPIVTFLFHYGVVGTAVPFAHDILIDTFSKADGLKCIISLEMNRRRQYTARFLATYFILYFCVRLARRRKGKSYLFYSEFYSITFNCSVTIVMSALSFYSNRPIVAQAFCIAVGMDHLMWWVFSDLFTGVSSLLLLYHAWSVSVCITCISWFWFSTCAPNIFLTLCRFVVGVVAAAAIVFWFRYLDIAGFLLL